MIAFVWFLLCCFGLVTGFMLGAYLIDDSEISGWLGTVVMICAFVLAIGSICVLLDRANFVDNRMKCATFGYVDTVRYKGNWFCVDYVDREPIMIPVWKVEEWDSD